MLTTQCAKAIVLFGSPGSGKGTQAKLLRQCMGVPHVSTGDMLREHIEAGDELGLEVKSAMQSGNLVSDDLVNRLVEDRLARPDCARGVILDGYPRTLPQAKVMGNLLAGRGLSPVVIHLQVDYTKVVVRMTGRRMCPVCGTLYSLTSNPPRTAGVCDKDGAALITRDDDREAVIRQRLDGYERQTQPLIDYFGTAGVPAFTVDGGEGTPQTIVNRICGLISVS